MSRGTSPHAHVAGRVKPSRRHGALALPRVDRGRRVALLFAVLASLAPALPFLPLLLFGETLWFRDFSLYFVPMKAFLIDTWRSGQLPLWDPYLRNGLPFLANPQTGVFYPPSLLLVLFGLKPGLALFLLFHLAAAGLGFYAFLRSMGFLQPAALLGGVAFAAGGYVASLLNVLNNLQVAVWAPWVLAAAVHLVERPGRGRWVLLVVAVLLMILGGELQLAALGCAAAALLLATRVCFDRPQGITAVLDEGVGGGSPEPERHSNSSAVGVLLLAAAVFVAAATAAVQLLPTLELVRESVRHGGLPFELAADDSMEPATLFSVAFPRPAVPGDAERGAAVSGGMPWLLSAYAGVAVVWLAVLGAGGPRRRWTVFWCVLAILGALLALGRHSFLFRAAFDLVPGFAAVRYPEKFLLWTALALPALAAAGVERVLARRIPLGVLFAGGSLIAGAAGGALVLVDDPSRLEPEAALVLGATAAVVTLGLLLLVRNGRLEARRGALLLCAVAAIDLGTMARAVNPAVAWRFYDSPWAARVLDGVEPDRSAYRIRSSPLAANMEQLAAVAQARIFSNHYLFQQGLAPNLGQLYGFLQQDGMAGIETQAAAELIDTLVGLDLRSGMRLLRLLGVKYLVTALPLPAEDVVDVAAHDEMPIGIVRLRGALPRAYLASRWEVAPERPDALRRALADTVAGRTVVLDEAPRWVERGPRAASPAASTAGSAKNPAGVVRRSMWHNASARLDVEAAQPAILVVTDSHYPGWRARLDGDATPLLRANGYQRAVAVPAGQHLVELDFRPPSLGRGAALSALALVFLTGLLVYRP